MARAAFDRGSAPADLPMERMLLVLNRSAAQEAELAALLDQQQDQFSQQYHRWLTPQEFGERFGAADQDLQTVTSWLQSQGFQVNRVSNGKTIIEFSGTAGQVQQTFHTEIRKYVVNGEQHWANASDPQIPAALGPVVAGVATLHNFSKKPQHISSKTRLQPQFTASSGLHDLSPADYATIYNISPLYQAGINGQGTTIAVVARSNINISDVTSFRSVFGLSANNPQVIVNGTDPGNLGQDEEAEAVLDVSWAGATAPGAIVKLVVSKTTRASDGVDLSEFYIIDHNLADVMTESFGSCEAGYTTAGANYYASLAQQAAAEGITYLVASGDSGAEGCDDPSTTSAARPLSVNILSSNPYAVAVGGTMFNENGNPSIYWNASNNSADASVKSYIPENAWNESGSAGSGLWATGGGASILYSKPSWQAGVAGIPNDGWRDVPDVSLTSARHDPYLICLGGSCTPTTQGGISFAGISGTSAATPAFAGIMALVVQKTGSRQGQANYVLYRLAASESPASCNASNVSGLVAANCIFNDVTAGNNAVPGESGYGTSSAAYQAGAGYDLATGLGSVNVTNLVNAWTGVNTVVSTGTPVLSVSTMSLSFGALYLGIPSSQQLTLSNTGTATLLLTGSGITGDTADFSYISACGSSIAVGASCSVTVTFKPKTSGSFLATLVFTDNAPTSSAGISLSGTGITSSILSLSSSTLDFGSQKAVARSSAQTVTITNSTSAAVSMSVSLGGTNSADFVMASNCGRSLTSAASCAISVIFSPSLTGGRTALLLIPNSSPGSLQAIPLTGTSVLTGLFEIVNGLTGKVLDVAGGAASDGTLIVQEALNGSQQQQWQFLPIGGGYYKIVNSLTGKVLDVTGWSTVNGTQIQQWDYLGGANQQWQLIPVDDVHYKIVNRGSGKVLDMTGGSLADGIDIQQWDDIGTPQQLWVLVPIGSYAISNVLSSDVLDVRGASTSSGTLIQQWASTGTRQQQWQLLPVGGGYYAIMSRLTGKVLDVIGWSTANGTQIQQFDYVGGANQHWQLVPLYVNNSVVYQIVNRLSGKVLDDTGLSTVNGTPVQQWDYLGSSNQQWQLLPVVFYNIANQLSGLVLDVSNGSSANGSEIQQWSSLGIQQQQWQLVSTGGGYYAIANNLTGKVLDVTGASASNGAQIQQWDYLGGGNQQWQLVQAAGGYYEVVNRSSGKVLDVIGWSTANGAQIQQWDFLGGGNQQWQFIPAPN
jgi:pseudomonalisin